MFSITHQYNRPRGRGHAKTIAGAAVAAVLCIANLSKASIVDVTSVNTSITQSASALTLDAISGDGNSKTFPLPSSYNVTYSGEDDKVVSLNAGGITYDAGAQATLTIRRDSNSDPDNDVVWYQGTGSFSSKPVALYGPNVTGYEQALGGNNLYMGADNLFTNQGDTANNDSDVERLDVVFNGGVPVNSNDAFAIMERGTTTSHDAFKIAAITSIDTNGNPTGYGPLISFNEGTWGKTALNANSEYITENRNDAKSTDPLHPANIEENQYLGGVLMHTGDFGVTGATIYGYSLFAPDVTGSGSQLLSWTNSQYFPTNEGNTGNMGGIDPVDTLGVLYTTDTAVPEPTFSVVAIAAAAGLLLSRRRPHRRMA